MSMIAPPHPTKVLPLIEVVKGSLSQGPLEGTRDGRDMGEVKEREDKDASLEGR